jgi:hypothetical protein
MRSVLFWDPEGPRSHQHRGGNLKSKQNYGSVYSNPYISRQQILKQMWQYVPEFDQMLVSLCMQLWYVSVIPKYLNFNTY